MNWTYFIIMGSACFLYVKSADFNCTEGEDCIVPCIGTQACYQANINCPSDARCDIQCIGGGACVYATLNWNNPEAGTGSLTCDGVNACSAVQYPIPLPDEALNITCDNYDECSYATIECPTNARCDIQCIGNFACDSATLNWNNPEAGTGSLTCDGLSACSAVQYPIPLPDEALNITCDNSYECAFATIECPTNAECRVICSGDEACKNVTIESCGQLEVTCAPANACTNKVQTCTTSPPTTATSQPTSQPTSSTSAPTTATSAPTTATSQPTSVPTAENSSDANDNACVYFCSCIFFLVMLFV